jgi:hypothetical protein
VKSSYLTTSLPLFFKAILVGMLAVSGCATVDDLQSPSKQFTDIINSFPDQHEQLKFPDLTKIPAPLSPSSRMPSSSEVYVIVHPGFAVFFQNLGKDKFDETKFRLLKKQFETEQEFISKRAASGATIILVLPGKASDGAFPATYPSYRHYLNDTAGNGSSVYFIYSETSSSGAIPLNEMMSLYYFIRGLRPARVMVAGGYIGRCQREFYNEFTNYFDKSQVFIVPQLSTISPDDVTEKEAEQILDGLEKQDYSLVKQFIDKKTGASANILPLP